MLKANLHSFTLFILLIKMNGLILVFISISIVIKELLPSLLTCTGLPGNNL